MKKLLSILLTILMVLTIVPASVFADENNIPNDYDKENWTYLESEKPKLWYWEDETVINSNNNQIQPFATTKLNVIRIRQRDSRWAGEDLGLCKTTIGDMGCALVSLTMAYNYVTGDNMTPKEINDLYPSKTCNSNSNGMVWSIQNNLGITIGDSVGVTNSTAYSSIKSHIQLYRPVIVYTEKPSSNPDEPYTHFMVAYGYDTITEDILVRDPDETNYQTLAEANDDGWDIKTYRYVDV